MEANLPQAVAALRRGWKLGGEDFLDWSLERTEVRVGEAHRGSERDETEEAKANRIIAEGLKQVDWTRADLKRHRRAIPVKVALARRLRAETAVSLKWIAANLEMGSWTHVQPALSRLMVCRYLALTPRDPTDPRSFVPPDLSRTPISVSAVRIIRGIVEKYPGFSQDTKS